VPGHPSSFVLLPAVDVADGHAVRLVLGEAGPETKYGAPLEVALAGQASGAQWVHVIDGALWIAT
jgi:phosphoribosylformimino-5-aminoimidazole carboxamide ribonucleotide (ProFAR) isomerase